MAFAGNEQPDVSQPPITHSNTGEFQRVRGDIIQTPYTRRDMGHFPLDILISIFQRVYDMSRTAHGAWIDSESDGEQHWQYISGRPSHWPENDDPFSPALFPEALASVCVHWREAMSCVSIFWTRFLIVIDDKKPTPLSTVRSYLAWSKDHPIDITVSRRPDHFTGQDSEERGRVAAVMALLYPHHARWRSLRIKVLHEASLPRFGVDMPNSDPCAHLVELRMTCALQDGPPTPPRAEFLVHPLDTPILETLECTGMAFREAHLTALTQPSSLRCLTISGYGSHHEPFPVRDLAQRIGELQLSLLYLRDLDLDCSYDGPSTHVQPSIESVTFEGIHGDVLDEFGRLLYTWSAFLTVKRCTVPRPIILGRTVELRLIDIRSSDDVFFLLAATGEGCASVSLYNCSGLDDSVLDKLKKRVEGPEGEIEWICSTMDSLDIIECTGFTTGALRGVVKARRSVHANTGFVDDLDPHHVVTSLRYLNVRGCGELSPTDQVWFNARVGYVNWDNWSGGYEWARNILRWQQIDSAETVDVTQ